MEISGIGGGQIIKDVVRGLDFIVLEMRCHGRILSDGMI